MPSHGAAVLLLTPLALLGSRQAAPVGVHRVEFSAQCSTLATATLLTLAPGHMTLGFAPLPVIVWAAFRFNAWIVVMEQVIFAVAVSLLTQLGRGPFADLVGSAASNTRYAQLYLICVVLIGLPLAIAMQQREHAVAAWLERAHVPPQLHRLTDPDRLLVTACRDRHGSPRPTLATAVLLGRPPEELVGRPLDDPLESTGFFEALDAMPPAPTRGWSGPVSVVDQPRTRLEATLSLLEHEGEHASFSLHMVDVTGPQELQERLQAERDYTRSVIDTASSMIVLTDVEGTVIVANPATTALTGYTEEELVGSPFWEHLITDDQRGQAAELFRDPSQLPLSGEAQLQTKGSGPRLVVFSADVYQATTDAPLTFVLSATDITEVRESAGMVEHLLRSARTIAFVGTDLEDGSPCSTPVPRTCSARPASAMGRELMEFIATEDIERYPRDGGRAAFSAIVEHAAGELTPETRDWTWLPAGGPRSRSR